MRTLDLGATGSDVSALQIFLKGRGYFTAEATGYFGPITKAAVMEYQGANGIDQVGTVGPKTRTLLNVQAAGSMTTQLPENIVPPLACPDLEPIQCPAGEQREVYSGCSQRCVPIPVTVTNACPIYSPIKCEMGTTLSTYVEDGCMKYRCVTPTQPAIFSASPTSGPAPLTVTFSNLTGGNAIEYGDGASSQTLDTTNSHTYTASGTFTATLYKYSASCESCMDITKKTKISSVTIDVSPQPPISTIHPTTMPTCPMNADCDTRPLRPTPSTGAHPLTVTFFVADRCVAGLASENVYRVSFGDNSESETIFPCGAVTLSHTYTTSGTFTASLQTAGYGPAPLTWNTNASVSVTVQ
jgi:peptidoglycan hydrolase-like protein with peptidoglycan-binding domain